MTAGRKELLVAQWTACHDEANWFAPAMATVAGLTAAEAAWRESEATHSVWEIVHHLTFWNERWLRRFQGLDLPPVTLQNADTFVVPVKDIGDAAWEQTVVRFSDVMDAWRNALIQSNEAKLDEVSDVATGQPWWHDLINLTIHNAYHIGQMVLVRRAMARWDA